MNVGAQAARRRAHSIDGATATWTRTDRPTTSVAASGSGTSTDGAAGTCGATATTAGTTGATTDGTTDGTTGAMTDGTTAGMTVGTTDEQATTGRSDAGLCTVCTAVAHATANVNAHTPPDPCPVLLPLFHLFPCPPSCVQPAARCDAVHAQRGIGSGATAAATGAVRFGQSAAYVAVRHVTPAPSTLGSRALPLATVGGWVDSTPAGAAPRSAGR